MSEATPAPDNYLGDIDALLREDRAFAPPPAFREQANVRDASVYEEAERDPEGFWARFAGELEWMAPWSRVLDWNPPHAKWFVGGKLNVSANCLDRHVRTARRNKAAIIWEGEPGDQRTLTYWELHREVNRFASALKSLGVKQGDRVAIYMPMVPELPVAMLACARIGAVHSVVFGGFSAGVAARPDQRRPGQGAHHGRRRLPARRDRAAEGDGRRGAHRARRASSTSWCVKRGGGLDRPVTMTEGRDVWYHDVMKSASASCEPEAMDAEDMLYILYTSGTTGKPKGIVHTTGGYLTGVYATTKWVFDLKEEDVFWCTADIGWVTGHSYVVYGPLANGATVRDVRRGARLARARTGSGTSSSGYGVTVFYTAPTAIRAFMRWGAEWPRTPRPDDAPPARHRRASRSTPRRGCGTTCTSAAGAARWWTPGGRRRRGTS